MKGRVSGHWLALISFGGPCLSTFCRPCHGAIAVFAETVPEHEQREERAVAVVRREVFPVTDGRALHAAGGPCGLPPGSIAARQVHRPS